MSRTSPGRYAIHEFAKNVYRCPGRQRRRRAAAIERPNPSQWDVAGHGGSVRVRYKVFGDRVDGTFLGIDTTHAHINIPAALMWARGLEGRPVAGDVRRRSADWKVATQLHPTGDPRTFTAANLQYLIDSPTEVSNFTLRTFRVDQRIPDRAAPRGNRSPRPIASQRPSRRSCARSARCSASCRRSRRRTRSSPMSCRRPPCDAMEHRNSTILTAPASLAIARSALDDAQQRRARVFSQLERRADPAALARAVQARRAESVR